LNVDFGKLIDEGVQGEPEGMDIEQ
jgi:hypothetical protein